jgi:hypothetical protein
VWVLKSSNENKKELRQHGLLHALIFWVLCLILLTVSVKSGYNKFNPGVNPRSWEEVLAAIPMIMLISIAVAVIAYNYGKKNLKKTRSQAFVCLGCSDNVSNTGQHTCKCGGKIVDLNHAKWVEIQDANNNN